MTGLRWACPRMRRTSSRASIRPNLLVVVDEAEGVAEPIYDAIEAVMTTGNCKLLLIGNPHQRLGDIPTGFP